jgi:peptidyl-prolyl cis-trans isomerase D
MLDLMRKKAGSWMIKFILAAIIIVFAFWGVGSFNAQRLTTVATVDDTIITFEAYREAYTRMVDQMRQRFGDRLDSEMIEALNFKQQAIDQLVNDRLLTNEARRLGLGVSDEELARAIASLEVFQRDGRFAPDLYRRLLEANRLTPESFEHEQRQAMLIGKLRDMVADTIQVSDGEARRWYDFVNTQVAVDYVRFEPRAFSDLSVTDDQAAAYYEAHKADYKTAPMRSVHYLRFSGETFADKAELSEDEVQDYYDDHPDEFRREAALEARHVLIRTTDGDSAEAVEAARRQALEVMEKARAGEDFAALARQHSQDGSAAAGGDLGRFTRREMVKPFADAAFALEAGQISEPVQTQFGWHVIKVEKRHPAATPALEEVAEQIRTRLRTGKAKALAREAAEAAWDAAFDASDLQAAARSQGLRLETTSRFDRQGPAAVPAGERARFAEAAFALAPDTVGDVLELDDGYYILQLNEEIPSEIPPLEALKDAVRGDALAAEQREQARQAAQAMLEALRGGQEFAAAARERGLTVANSGLFGRQGMVEKIGVARELAAAAFDLSLDRPLPEQVFEVDQNWYVIRFERRQAPPQDRFEQQKEALAAQLNQQKAYEALEALLARLRAGGRIEVNHDML